jgi:transposase
MSQRTLAKNLAEVKPGTVFVGIDLALDRNVVVAVDEHAKRLARFRFNNDQDGYQYFRRRLRKLQKEHAAPAVLVGMEPTNYFWKLVAADLEAHEVSYRLVNPYTVKKHREGNQLDRSKDDRRDASTIAELLRTGKYTETRLLHGRYAELREYVTLYERLRRDARRQKTLISNIAGQVFPELRRAFKDLSGQTALAMLRTHAAAAAIAELEVETLIADVRAAYSGKRLAVSKLRQAHALAAHSVGVREGIQALQCALRVHIVMLTVLELQIEQVKEELSETFLALPEAQYLLSVHGLGLLTAATILAEIGDPSHFSAGSQLVKLAGIQPVPNSSGRKSRSKTPMSRKGRPRLRTALFFAVMRLVQVDDAFARRYQELQHREKNPLLKLQALGALMTKLLHILWTLMRQRTFYNPDYQRAA